MEIDPPSSSMNEAASATTQTRLTEWKISIEHSAQSLLLLFILFITYKITFSTYNMWIGMDTDGLFNTY